MEVSSRGGSLLRGISRSTEWKEVGVFMRNYMPTRHRGSYTRYMIVRLELLSLEFLVDPETVGTSWKLRTFFLLEGEIFSALLVRVKL